MDDLKKHLAAGGTIDLQAALRVEKAAREKADNDAVVLQLLVARIEKAIGMRVDQKILIGALIVTLTKTIAHSPIERWEPILMQFMQATAGGLESVRLQYAANKAKAAGNKPPEVTLPPTDNDN